MRPAQRARAGHPLRQAVPRPRQAAEQPSDRERIAAELANSIAHQLNRTSLELHNALSHIEHHQDPAAQIRNAVGLLDDALRDLSRAVFNSSNGPPPDA